ncbi:MAG: hypothetical protein AAF378_10120 [Cyanobacteria bacterium P01_A01_bin.84]
MHIENVSVEYAGMSECRDFYFPSSNNSQKPPRFKKKGKSDVLLLKVLAPVIDSFAIQVPKIGNNSYTT